MSTRSDLPNVLARLDGASYGAYKQLKGEWELTGARLYMDRVQSDPYAPPSMARVRVGLADTGIPSHLLETQDHRVAAADFLTRAFSRSARDLNPRGGKDAGGLHIQRVGQEIMPRSAVVITSDHVEVRCEIALPAAGRRIKGRAAQHLLLDTLPDVLGRSLDYSSLDAQAFALHVQTYLDSRALRSQLSERGLVAFIADGALLPRASGHTDVPARQGVVPFESPDSLSCELVLASGVLVSGMGIPEGVTVIVGGGYHGKSTVLQAVERGVYDHVPGDGRERVVAVATAASVRAEDGRPVTTTDVSPFIKNLPTGADTTRFTTTNASGSTSQAASTVEALESGARVLLLDEDTCATNLMVRDERMRALVPGNREPITPFVDRVRALFTEQGVSTVLVTGGSGAFLDVADLVIALDEYRALDVTARAREVVQEVPAGAAVESLPTFGVVKNHVPPASSASQGGGGGGNHGRGSRDKPARGRGVDTIQLNREDIDLSAVSQLVDAGQTEAIARLLDAIAREADGHTTLREIVRGLLDEVQEHGLDVLGHGRSHPGHLSLPRAQEVHAAYHRVR